MEKEVKKAPIVIQKPKAKPIFTGPRLEIQLKSGAFEAAFETAHFLVDNSFYMMEYERQKKVLKPFSVNHYFSYWNHEMRYMYRDPDTKKDDIYIGKDDDA